MVCPNCGSKTEVIGTAKGKNRNMRIYKCTSCKEKILTSEEIVSMDKYYEVYKHTKREAEEIRAAGH